MAGPAHNSERTAGLLLMGAAALALLIANSPLAEAYHLLLETDVGPLTVHYWIADALMAIFFLLVGLEVKREWYDGQLATPEARKLPIIAAALGMAVPALVYKLTTGFDPALSSGWAIPAATDIAFALGLLALLGPRVPASIKVLLVTIAIIDDIGAVAIIAVFYTAEINMTALAISALLVGAMATLNLFGVRRLWPYLLLFPLLWLAVFQSGIHATIAGVVAALTIPLGRGEAVSPLKKLEHKLHPLVMFGIVPLFGLASAGVTLAGLDELLRPLPLGVATGLFVGKQLGVFGAIWIADRTGLARKPEALRWAHVYGAALLCGVGFTMSLFIGELAFDEYMLVEEAKIGTLLGSILSGIAGYIVLALAKPIGESERDRDEAAEIFGEDADEDPTVCNDPYAPPVLPPR
ncbi:NhaA family Na+:H+ antiporter [Sphingomonas kaistensis]|uniref:Na(+)/H(+) antiporter NhaA n=1 Tax=Sphingomonas kaistensis TaxID=298708 RepID=A0A7X5Y4F4_9SPHN|nr:Na+/H+ antiporter NhaA [Sphingomonas kaistensis]NJC04984.1 NhaA family Na+:H+ antiporter [Sphingomonas kaistensis]